MDKEEFLNQKKRELILIEKELEMMRKDMAKNHLDIPFVPSSEEKVNTMIELAAIGKGENAADLGCGDGRVLIALARAGANACGFEIEKERVLLSRSNIREAKLEDRIKVHNTNFFSENLSGFDLITIYGITSMMQRLEEKLNGELIPGAKIVSNRFTFPNWKPILEKNNVYLYIKE